MRGSRGSRGRQQYGRRSLCTEFKPQYTVKAVKDGSAKIMAWGYFSYDCVGLFIVNQRSWISLNTSKYFMLLYAKEQMPLKRMLHQDNDPKQ